MFIVLFPRRILIEKHYEGKKIVGKRLLARQQWANLIYFRKILEVCWLLTDKTKKKNKTGKQSKMWKTDIWTNKDQCTIMEFRFSYKWNEKSLRELQCPALKLWHIFRQNLWEKSLQPEIYCSQRRKQKTHIHLIYFYSVVLISVSS